MATETVKYVFTRESETGGPVNIRGVGERVSTIDGDLVAGLEDGKPASECTIDLSDAIEEARAAGFWEQDYSMVGGFGSYCFVNYRVVVEVER